MGLSLLYPPEWVQYARCGGDPDPDRFFPDADRDESDLAGLTERQRRTVRRKRREAVRAFCNGCRVQQECLNYALANDEPVGVWGGLTRQERDALQRDAHVAPDTVTDVTDEQLTEAAYKHETYQKAAASLGITRDEYLERVKAAGLWSWWNRPFTPHEKSLVFTDRRELTLEALARQLQRSRAQLVNALQTRRRQLRRQARRETEDNGQ